MGFDIGCQMCQRCPSESALHLIFLCPNSIQVWYEIAVKVGYRLMAPDTNIEVSMAQIETTCKIKGENQIQRMVLVILMCLLDICKSQNEKYFSGRLTNSLVLADQIVEEGHLWLKFCNTGTRRLMGHNMRPDPDKNIAV